MEELLVQIDTSKHVIATNFDDIKAQLSETLDNYKGIIVDETTIKQSKADLAELRKMREEIETKRKEIKKEWEKPYNEFKAKCDELNSMIDAPINEIKGQLDEFEVKRVQEKKEHVMQLYAENIGEYEEYLPYSRIENVKWYNATATDKDFLFDLSQLTTKVKTELDAIKALNSEIEEDLLKTYKVSGNSLTAAITKNSDYLQAKSKVEETMKATVKEEPKTVLVDTETGEIIPDFTFRVSGADNIQKIKDFLDFSEIPYTEV